MEEVTSNKPWLGGSHDRRQYPRLACRGVLSADLKGLGERMPVRDLSQSGFALELPTPLQPATLYQCGLRPDDGPAIGLLAQVARSDRHAAVDAYVTGFKFSLYEADASDRLKDLMVRFGRRLGFDQAPG